MLPSFWRGGWGTQDCPRWKRKQYSARVHFGEKLTSAGGKLRAGHGKSFALCAVLRFWLGYIFAHMFGPVLIIKFWIFYKLSCFFFGRAIFVFFHSANSYKPGIFRVPIRYLCIFVSQQKKKKKKQSSQTVTSFLSRAMFAVPCPVGSPSTGGWTKRNKAHRNFLSSL